MIFGLGVLVFFEDLLEMLSFGFILDLLWEKFWEGGLVIGVYISFLGDFD